MPGDLHHVVDAAHEPEIAVGVALRAVAGEVPAGVPAPVGLAVAIVVLVDPAEHRGPRPRDDEVAGLPERDALPLLVDDVGLYTGERDRRAARLRRRDAGKRRD